MCARRQLAVSVWAQLEETRSRVSAAIGVTLRPLPAFDQGRTALAMRIREAESVDRARADCEHVLDVRRREAVAKNETKWLSGSMFEAGSWRVALAMSAAEADRPPAQARAGPRGQPPDEPIRRIKTL